jgi:hypothetical protein
LHNLSHLKIDRSRGAAPHKPLLLLCLLELAEEGAMSQEIMPITGELAFRFASYWSVVAYRRPQKPDLKLPLFHMRSEGRNRGRCAPHPAVLSFACRPKESTQRKRRRLAAGTSGSGFSSVNRRRWLCQV